MTVKPAEIDNSVPTEDEIAVAVTKLRRNRSGGPSRICVEHLKGWLTAAKRGGLAKEKGKEKTETEEEGDEGMLPGHHQTEVLRPLELRLSGSRRSELNSTVKCHPRGTISR